MARGPYYVLNLRHAVFCSESTAWCKNDDTFPGGPIWDLWLQKAKGNAMMQNMAWNPGLGIQQAVDAQNGDARVPKDSKHDERLAKELNEL